MEIRWKNDEGGFTMRAAALVLRNGHALFAKSDGHDCYYTIGGGVCQNEDSEAAVLRECFEETGCRLTVERLVFVQERFYTAQQLPRHEVTFYYLMKDSACLPGNGMATDRSDEHLFWLPVEKLGSMNVVPAFLRTALQNLPTETLHIISRE